MTRDQAITLILNRLGNRAHDTYLQAAAVSEMQLAQETKLEGADFKPWFLLSENMFATTGIDDRRVPVPVNFLEEHEEGTLWVQQPGTTEWIRLRREDPDVLEEYYGVQVGIPERYSVVKNYFTLFPIPSQKYPLKMRCFLREAVLIYPYGTEQEQSTRTNAWLTECPDWLIGETGKVLAGQYIRDQDAAAWFEKMALESRTRMYASHIAREEMNRTRSMGDD